MRVALDVGGTNFRYRFVHENQIEEGSFSTQGAGLIESIEKIIVLASEIAKPEFVGISFAGQVHHNTILSSPNIPVEPIDLAEYFHNYHGITVRIENDLKCAALAEWHVRNLEQGLLVALFPGTGLGSAYVEDGRLIRGAENLAGEAGHIPFRRAPFACGCGKNDCAELYASGSGLRKWIEFFDLPLEQPSLHGLAELKTIESSFILENFHQALACVAASLVAILNPSMLVLGGGIMQNNPELADFLRSELGRSAPAFARHGLRVEVSSLENAAIEGAARLSSTLA